MTKKNVVLCIKEHAFLREELQHLKECQVRFLTFSVMTTGLILGFIIKEIGGHYASSESKGSPPSNLWWLLPLVILLPSWWIFFDKATTINRIIGYFRIIEKLILEQIAAGNFLGWESALAEYRKLGGVKEPQGSSRWKKLTGAFCLLFFRTTRHYWVIVMHIFLWLSLLCLFASLKKHIIIAFSTFKEKGLLQPILDCVFISIVKEPAFWFYIFVGVFVGFSAFRNIRILWDLVYGKYSDDLNEKFWCEVLKVVE
ncbi:MAG TPA: hypothetical protein ACFYD6_07335 [Candidatus Brocadiia bacterium]|nr:hypothetical protein [Candidatus Brocadiales bacterium]